MTARDLIFIQKERISMAQEQSQTSTKTPWTKIFSAFKIALDLKKLVLAALGILFVWAGWWVVGAIFYHMRELPK